MVCHSTPVVSLVAQLRRESDKDRPINSKFGLVMRKTVQRARGKTDDCSL